MKYIRTKDEIYEINRDLKNFHKIVATEQSYPVLWHKNIAISSVIKQADTIEELCDEFVILPLNQNKQPFHHFLRTAKIDDITPYMNDSHIIYGAIWTDKGLIYVAKMNEKGELELL